MRRQPSTSSSSIPDAHQGGAMCVPLLTPAGKQSRYISAELQQDHTPVLPPPGRTSSVTAPASPEEEQRRCCTGTVWRQDRGKKKLGHRAATHLLSARPGSFDLALQRDITDCRRYDRRPALAPTSQINVIPAWVSLDQTTEETTTLQPAASEQNHQSNIRHGRRFSWYNRCRLSGSPPRKVPLDSSGQNHRLCSCLLVGWKGEVDH